MSMDIVNRDPHDMNNFLQVTIKQDVYRYLINRFYLLIIKN